MDSKYAASYIRGSHSECQGTLQNKAENLSKALRCSPTFSLSLFCSASGRRMAMKPKLCCWLALFFVFVLFCLRKCDCFSHDALPCYLKCRSRQRTVRTRPRFCDRVRKERVLHFPATRLILSKKVSFKIPQKKQEQMLSYGCCDCERRGSSTR